MRSVVPVRFLVTCCLTLVGFTTFLICPVKAQKQLASEAQLQKDYDTESMRRFYRLFSGDQELTRADDALLKAAARWFVYRLTVTQHWSKPGHMHTLVKEYEDKVRGMMGGSNEAKTYKFREQFVKELIPCLQEVLALDLQENQPAVINAGVMLGALGHTGSESAGDFLAELLKNAKTDVVRLFAFKGLQEYYQARPAAVDPLAENVVRQREIRRLGTLTDFVSRKSDLADSASPGELEAYRFVRREAIKALAEARVPALPLLPGADGELHAPVAYTLLRVLSDGKDALSPPPSLSEKYEAALGLCRIRAKQVPKYRPELAVALVANFLVEFSQTYNADWVHFANRNKDAKIPMLPWKASADQLREGIKELAANTPGDAQKQAEELKKNTDAIFADMRKYNQVDFTLLRTTLRALPRPDPVVYRGVPAYQIELRQWPPSGG